MRSSLMTPAVPSIQGQCEPGPGRNEDSAGFCIGFLGADWWGSDALALASELRQSGHLLVERHYEDYLPTKWRSLPLRAIRRLMRPIMATEYNRAIEELLNVEALDFLLAFKGMLLRASTLRKFRELGKPCYCVYPDVSFDDHGSNIRKCLPLYDCVFTTKSFHLLDDSLRNVVRDLQLVPHGFDPSVHRPVTVTPRLQSAYGCDVSFVGCWSGKKEDLLASVIAELPNIDLRIWGPSWSNAALNVRSRWQGRGAYGDELAAIYCCSKINLGLLSEAGGGTTEGDRTTARTWQIPASRGFLLHEATDELSRFFEPGVEVATFDSDTALTESIQHFLSNESLRLSIRDNGFSKCHSAGYSYAAAADVVVRYHRECRH